MKILLDNFENKHNLYFAPKSLVIGFIVFSVFKIIFYLYYQVYFISFSYLLLILFLLRFKNKIENRTITVDYYHLFCFQILFFLFFILSVNIHLYPSYKYWMVVPALLLLHSNYTNSNSKYYIVILSIILFKTSELLNTYFLEQNLFNIDKILYFKLLDDFMFYFFFVFNYMLALHIITNRLKYENFLILTNEELKKSKKSKEDFFAHISHEIRTPVNIIVGISNMLINNNSFNNKNTRNFEYFSALKESSNSLLTVLNDLLELTKFEKYSIEIQEKPLDLRSSLYLIDSFFKYKLKVKKLFLEYNLDHRISYYLLGDQNRINQILMNFVSNSIKYSFKGSINVNFKLVEDKVDSQLICFEIIDTGIGMSEEFLKIIFEPFTQENSGKYKGEGSGLGMNICKNLIDKMNGTIQIKSDKNVGTQVSFIIEFKKSKIHIDEYKNMDTTNTDKHPTFNSKNILIVDDNDFNRMILKNNLSKYCFTIFEATNGFDAILVLENNKIDLVFMDIGMPMMDGLECAKKVRNTLKLDVPIIAFTANAIILSNEYYLESRMNDILLKPYKEEDLKIIIEKYLGIFDLKTSNDNFIYKENKNLYSFDNFIENGKYNIELIKKLVDIFIHSSLDELKIIENAIKTNKLDEFKFYSHKLKSSVLYFKIEKSGSILKDFQNLTEINEKHFALFDVVKSEINTVIDQLKNSDLDALNLKENI